MLSIITRGKLDYAEGVWLIHEDAGIRVLHALLTPQIGKRIVVSVEEPEEELDPIINKRLKRALVNA